MIFKFVDRFFCLQQLLPSSGQGILRRRPLTIWWADKQVNAFLLEREQR